MALLNRKHKHVEEIASILVTSFGKQNLGNKRNPFDELLYILLSSKTPPKRYQTAYKDLKRAFPKSNELAVADWKGVACIIRDAGLQNRKAKAIVRIAKQLVKERSRVSLSFLGKLSDYEVEKYLTSLPEISIKSARCIMMYSLGRNVFPIDSHCLRICRRIRWIGEATPLTGKLADFLQEGIPTHLRKDLHVSLVLLGRHTCLASNPKCNVCLIRRYCPTGKENMKTAISTIK